MMIRRPPGGVSVSWTPEELAEQLFTKDTDGDYVLERFWKVVIQRLIDEGADIEFYYNTNRRNMDFQLRSTDRLIYEIVYERTHQETLVFTWQRTNITYALQNAHMQGLYNSKRMMGIDFITDGDLKRVIKRVYEKMLNKKRKPVAVTPAERVLQNAPFEAFFKTAAPYQDEFLRLLKTDFFKARPVIEHDPDKD